MHACTHVVDLLACGVCDRGGKRGKGGIDSLTFRSTRPRSDSFDRRYQVELETDGTCEFLCGQRMERRKKQETFLKNYLLSQVNMGILNNSLAIMFIL